jgi:DNA helicase II / ATP-dependent DNA helicase PcrA
MIVLDGLNEKQREAVLNVDGALLILAGAGSGKTRVLTYRIAHLIENLNVYPSSILAITFTNKAAKEMKERVSSLLGELSAKVWVSTFHSMCIRMLRRDIEKIGYDKNFVIYDSADQQTLIKECIKELDYNEKNFPPKAMLEEIGKAKDDLITPDGYQKMNQSDFRANKIGNIYMCYQKKLKQNNAMDFDDIINNTIKLLNEADDVLEYYRSRFKYVMVDEYQDTNTAQYTLVNMLAQGSRNLCVVGDDDQSIYGWRGANIRNILDFEKDFKDAKVIKLEQNYRSTKNILDAANSVIKNNYGRKNKKLWTDNSTGSLIKYFKGSTEREEASFITYQISESIKRDDRKYKDFCVLYRINAQSRVIEESLIREGIPYKILGGLKFYDRKEVKDILAYLRVIQNPADNISLKRIINVPRRGIGNSTIDSLENIANKRGINIFSIVSSAGEIEELKRPSAKLVNFADMINMFMANSQTMSVSKIIENVLAVSGLMEELKLEGTDEAKTRIENLNEFISVALDFESQTDEPTLEEFLSHISLVSDVDKYDEDSDSIVLMTLHSAKGLEFPVVFLIGMEDGIFPGHRSMISETALEEERRLCYVGITRAREVLYLTNAYSRTLFGNTSYNAISRFLKEIPTELIEGAGEKKDEPVVSSTEKINKLQNSQNYNVLSNVSTDVYSLGNVNKITKASYKDLNIGDKVKHKKFGLGTIISIEPEDEDLKLEIHFELNGMKRLMAQYANLERLM